MNPGDQLGAYRLEEQLGVGGTGSVWAAIRTTDGTRWALKFDHTNRPRRLRRLLQEGRVQQRLRHPNVLPVLEAISLDSGVALRMPLVEGASLDTLLAHHRPDQPEAVAIFTAICRGLAHVHAAGLVHRDLKPANVLLSVQKQAVVPRIADFGLVLDADADDSRITEAGAVVGTLAYAAPEQLRDARSAGQPADLWSLGVVLVELLAGHRPFDAERPAALLQQHETPDLSGVPPLLLPLAAQLLSPAPIERPASVQAVLRALEPHLPADDPLRGRLARTVGTLWTQRSGVASNLSVERDPFIGRAEEIHAVARALRDSRLVSVVGVGGAGKTRLACRVARHLADSVRGVWMVSLVDARDRADILRAVAGALSLPADPKRLPTALAARGPVLLLLDNCEQITAPVAALVQDWLEVAPEARILVTSRQPLSLDAEVVVPLQPLHTAHAAALFRARAAAISGLPGGDGDPEVDALVELLDGLPLAIELAAARTRMLSPQQIRERLRRRFSLLRSRDPSLSPRQRSLRATLEWSWELLRPVDQQALTALSVFEGGFTPADAVAFLDGDPDDAIGHLADNSLLQRGRRTRMLVSVRAFAEGKHAAGERAAAERRHYTHFAAQSRAHLERRGTMPVIPWTHQERDNLLAAHQHARASGDRDAQLWLLASLITIDNVTGRLLEDIRDIAQDEAMPRKHRARLLVAAARRERRSGQAARALQTITTAEALVDTAPMLTYVLSIRLDILQSMERLEEAHTVGLRALEASNGEAPYIQRLLGINAYLRGERAQAESLFRDSLAAAEARGDVGEQAMALDNLGFLLRNTARTREAIPVLQQAAAMLKAQQRIFDLTHTTNQLGLCYLSTGDLEAAEAHMRRAATLFGRHGDVPGQHEAQMALAHLFARTGRLREASDLFARLAQSAHRHGMALRAFRENLNHAIVLTRLGKADAAEAAVQRAQSVGVDSELFDGWLHLSLAKIADLRGNPEAARAQLDRAIASAETLDSQDLLALIYLQAGAPEAALAAARAEQSPWLEGRAWLLHAEQALDANNTAAAGAACERAEALLRTDQIAVAHLAVLRARLVGTPAPSISPEVPITVALQRALDALP